MAYVWAANDKNKLEKRIVELGEYDEELAEYQIVSGLADDEISEDGEMPLDEGMVDDTALPEGADMMDSLESSDGDTAEEDSSNEEGENDIDTEEGQDSEQEPEG